MQEMKRELAEMSIRSDLNIIFITSKLIVRFMEMADRMPLARQALQTACESLLIQAADVYGRVLRDYAEDADVPCTSAQKQI